MHVSYVKTSKGNNFNLLGCSAPSHPVSQHTQISSPMPVGCPEIRYEPVQAVAVNSTDNAAPLRRLLGANNSHREPAIPHRCWQNRRLRAGGGAARASPGDGETPRPRAGPCPGSLPRPLPPGPPAPSPRGLLPAAPRPRRQREGLRDCRGMTSRYLRGCRGSLTWRRRLPGLLGALHGGGGGACRLLTAGPAEPAWAAARPRGPACLGAALAPPGPGGGGGGGGCEGPGPGASAPRRGRGVGGGVCRWAGA